MSAMRSSLQCAMAWLFVVFLATPAVAQGFAAQYQGELIDDQARPLAGIFALTFKLYEGVDATEALWEEQHYVAVVEGEYSIRLGEQIPLDSQWAETELFVAVEFSDQEIVREAEWFEPAAPLDIELTARDPVEYLREALPDNIVEVTFAQLADRALVSQEAEHAANADRLGGHTLEEIDRYNELVEMFAEHQIDPEAHGGIARQSARSTGDSTMVLQRVGGEGGTPFTRMCPRGYVMVGLQGAAGGLVDSIQVVCAPLE